MSTTKADATYTWNGLTIKQKLTPWQTTKLNSVKYVVVHNTNAVKHSNSSMSAQYCLAQFNHNLGDVCVHYYVDNKEIWHCLPDTIKGVHATDDYNKNGGNWNGIAVEIIEDKTDAVAEDRGAKLCASLLIKNGLGIDALKQHHDFYNKDCPLVIRPHWADFKAKVSKYMDELTTPPKTAPQSNTDTIYRVQVGAFGKKENAEAFAKELKAKGYSPIITEVKKNG